MKEHENFFITALDLVSVKCHKSDDEPEIPHRFLALRSLRFGTLRILILLKAQRTVKR